MTTLCPPLKFKAFNVGSTTPLVGGKLYTYDAGTTTPRATYKDSTLLSLNTNPVILNSNGEADVWLDSGSYKLVLKAADDSTVWPAVDNVTSLESAINILTADSVKVVLTAADLSTTNGTIDQSVIFLRGITQDGVGSGIFNCISSSGLSNDGTNIFINGSIAWVRAGYFEENTEVRTIPLSNILASYRQDGTKVNTVIISDSFGDGVGASVFQNRFGEMLERAVTHDNPNGFGYGSHVRLTDIVGVAGSGFTSTGVITTGGALESRLRLSAGQVLTITGYEVDGVDFWYEGGTATGDINIAVNGVLQRAYTTVKVAGIRNSFSTQLYRRTRKTDVITFTATGGLVDVTGFCPTRNTATAQGNYLVRISHGGWSYKTYNSATIAAEVNSYGNFNGGTPVYVFQLGTNSIYNPSEAQTPSDMIASMVAFIAKLAALNANSGFIVTIPPKTNEAMWPVITPGYTYDDYRKALVDHCENNGIQMVRVDQIGLEIYGLLSDGVHPRDAGHIQVFYKYADALGLGKITNRDQDRDAIYSNDATYLNSWDDGAGAFQKIRVQEKNGIAYLTGVGIKNASVSATFANIPARYWPDVTHRFQATYDAAGAITSCYVDKTNGNIVVEGTLPTTNIFINTSWPIVSRT